MILSSTGLEQSMVKETPPFFFPFEAAARLILTPLLSLYIPKPYWHIPKVQSYEVIILKN